MAREFGVRSYKPEEVSFIKSGNDGYDGSPWKQVERKLPKNILLEAFYNPSTLENLSMELGVAVPYMEEEVGELLDVELLSKNGDKYETNFIILSRDAQRDINNKQKELSEGFFNTACEILMVIEDDAAKNKTALFGGYATFEEIKWTLMLRLSDNARDNADLKRFKPTKKDRYTEHPRGGRWDIMGFEDYKDEKEVQFVGLNGFDYDGMHIAFYKIGQNNLWQRAGQLSDNEGRNLSRLIRGEREKCDTAVLDGLVNRGFLRKDGNDYVPTMIVAKGYGLIKQACSADVYEKKVKPLCDTMEAIIDELNDFIEERILKEVPPRLANMIWFYVETIDSMRGHMVARGLDAGVLKAPENVDTSTMGMYVVV